MESIFKNLKDFLLNDVNGKLEKGLKAFDENYIVFGLLDISRYSGAKNIVSILPESQSLAEGNTFDTVMQNEILLTVVCANDTFSNVQKNIVKYAKAITEALIEKTQWEGSIEDVYFKGSEFTFDAGNISGQMSAVEIRLTINTVIEAE